MYINKIETRITSRIKTVFYLQFFTPERIKLHGSTESKITEDENIENIPRLEITEVALVHRNTINNDYQQDS